MIYLDYESLLHIGRRAIGAEPEVRDAGLLASALARPRASAFGEDAYADIHAKAAALMHSLARGHALVDGNKRLALGAMIVFYGINGMRLTFSNDAAYDRTVAVATGHLDAVEDIASALRRETAPR